MSAPTTPAAHRATIARLTRLHGPTDQRVLRARRNYAAAQIEAQVERIVASAPPFTPAQIARIGAILDSAAPSESALLRQSTTGAGETAVAS